MPEYEVEFELTFRVMVQFEAEDDVEAAKIADEMSHTGDYGSNVPELIDVHNTGIYRVGFLAAQAYEKALASDK